MSGGRSVFAVSRSIWDDSDFASEPFTEREAWLWLVSSAAWKDTRTRGNAGPLDLRRGEFSFSVRFLAEKWQWTKSRVDRFIQRIEKRDMIRDTSRDTAKVYSIKNYNHFQVVGLPKRDSVRDDDRDSSGTAAGQQRDKEETGKQGNKVIAEEGAFAPRPQEQSPQPSKSVVLAPLPEWLPVEAWAGFLEMRRKMRKPPTRRASELLLKRLGEFVAAGFDPADILDKSTQNNWADIYAPKDGTKHGNARKVSTSTDKHLAGIVDLAGELRRRRAGGPH